MANRSRNSVAQLMLQLARHDAAALSDGQLLDAFVERRDEAALTAMVQRHAQMVWAVCRRLLRNHHDAEDAFQATFLVLVRKAPNIREQEKLANFLHGVARQTAVRLRAIGCRRERLEQQLMNVPEAEVGNIKATVRSETKLLTSSVGWLPYSSNLVPEEVGNGVYQ